MRLEFSDHISAQAAPPPPPFASAAALEALNT